MVGRAKSQYQKEVEHSNLREELVLEAVHRYQNQESHTADGGQPKRKSMKTIAQEVSRDHPVASRRGIVPSQSTISRRLNGGISLAKSREKNSHLTRAECRIVVDYTIELSERGIPLSHRRLEEHINEILRQRDPTFPGVGKNYTQRFIDRHRSLLSTCWSRTLDGRRGGAVNSTTNKMWFKLLGDAINKNDIVDENTYGMDETGIQPGEGAPERVITSAGNSSQPQKRSGGRETITVMVTICADGTTIPPTVIFKGQHYLVRWSRDNPLNASIGHSQKGWVTGEIALGWIQDFDKRTTSKAAGRARLLLLDGHASHLTRAFLEYAKAANIIVLCYPSHSTHVYQGLDVVCFGPFKHFWSAHRDEYERETGLVIQKANFMRIMSQAYVQTFTPHNILSAFRKTGVMPFDPSAISAKAMSVAVETSTQESLPIQQSLPVQALVKLAMQASAQAKDTSTSVGNEAVEELRTALASTSFDFLLDPSAVPIEHELPPIATCYDIKPLSAETRTMLSYTPQTEQELKLTRALHELTERDILHNEAARTTSMIAVLQGIYCARLKEQLFSSEKPGEKESGRLLGDGLPAVLTSDDFLAQVVSRDEWRDNQAQLKEARKEARKEQKEAMATWKEKDRVRIEENKADAQEYELELARWQAERDRAKREGTKIGWLKPKKPARRPPIARPMRRQVRFELSEEDSPAESLTEDEQDSD